MTVFHIQFLLFPHIQFILVKHGSKAGYNYSVEYVF